MPYILKRSDAGIAERWEDLRQAFCELCQKWESMGMSFPPKADVLWREHKKHDKERLEEQMRKERHQLDRDRIIRKLTPYERKLLGV